MGHTTLLKASCKSGPVRIICDASLQKQVHPHLLHQYIQRTPTPDNSSRPSTRWPVLQKHTYLERAQCMTTPGCLLWVFLFQPPSGEEEFIHRWILATTDKVENTWQIRYQSTTSTMQHAVVYRTHMKRQRWPPFAPLQDGAFSFLWDDPHHAVWFPAGFIFIRDLINKNYCSYTVFNRYRFG